MSGKKEDKDKPSVSARTPRDRKDMFMRPWSEPSTPRSTLLQFPEVFIDSRYGQMRLCTWEDRGDSRVVKKVISGPEDVERLALRPSINLRPTRETLATKEAEKWGSLRSTPLQVKASAVKAEPVAGSSPRKTPGADQKHFRFQDPRTAYAQGDDSRIETVLGVTALRAASEEGHKTDEDSDSEGRPASEDDVMHRRKKKRQHSAGRKPRVAFALPDEAPPTPSLSISKQVVRAPSRPGAPSLRYTRVTTGSDSSAVNSARSDAERSEPQIRVEILSKDQTLLASLTSTGEDTRSDADGRPTQKPMSQNGGHSQFQSWLLSETSDIKAGITPGQGSGASEANGEQTGHGFTPDVFDTKDAESSVGENSGKALDTSILGIPNGVDEGPKEEEYFVVPKEATLTLPLGPASSDVNRVQELQRQRALRNLEPARKFSERPGAAPLVVCFDYYGTDLTHKQVKMAIDKTFESTPTAQVVSLQFLVRNVMLGTKWVTNRWVITVNTPIAVSLLMGKGLSIGDKSVRCKRYEDIQKEEYNKFLDYKTKGKNHGRST